MVPSPSPSPSLSLSLFLIPAAAHEPSFPSAWLDPWLAPLARPTAGPGGSGTLSHKSHGASSTTHEREWIGERHRLRVGTDGDDGCLLTTLPSPTALRGRSRYRRGKQHSAFYCSELCGRSGLGSPLFRSQYLASAPSRRPPSHRGRSPGPGCEASRLPSYATRRWPYGGSRIFPLNWCSMSMRAEMLHDTHNPNVLLSAWYAV